MAARLIAQHPVNSESPSPFRGYFNNQSLYQNLFTDNNDGPGGGTTVRQDPVWSWQGHVSYGFRNRMWLAFDLNYFWGGATSIDGQGKTSLQSNSRVGLTLSIPIKKRHSIKLAVATGAYTRAGADFDIGTIAYQFRWDR